MNRTIVILNLLVSSIARPINEPTTAKNEDELSKADDFTTQSSETTEDTLSIVVNKDDLLNMSDLNKIYNSVENVFGKTRYLKEQPDNDAFEKPEAKLESRTSKKSKSAETSDEKPEERNKPEERSGTTDKAITKKIKDDSKSADTTSEVSEFESTTPSNRMDSKTANSLENDKSKIKVEDKAAPEEKSGRRNIEIVNDESNSAWNLLDDIPATRRMLSRPDNLKLDIKGNSVNKNIELSETRNVPLSYLSPNNNPHGTMARPSISIPHVHSSVTRPNFHLAPYITLRTAIPIDFRRILSQEQNNMLNNQTPFTFTGNSKLVESRGAEELNSDDELSNAYPYTPPVSETTKMPQMPPTNIIFTKLAQASEHPQAVAPNYYYNRENIKIFPQMTFSNVMPVYSVPTNYDIYRYVTGFPGYPQYA